MRLAWLIAISGSLASGLAQTAEPRPAPAEVHLAFATEDGRYQFHVGELIPVTLSYSADVADRYVLVSNSGTLVGGRGFSVSCSPSPAKVDSLMRDGDFDRFEEMLVSPCEGTVRGSAVVGCGDCYAEHPLDSVGVRFLMKLNTFVRFTTPGTYSCVTSAADVTAAPREEEFRQPLLVTSNPVVLTIVDDPQWAHAAVVAYAQAYEELCRGDDAMEHHLPECFDRAARITYLDTRESLAAEVRMFDGPGHRWDNGFWTSISSSSFPDDALRLMTARIQDGDFQASPAILESLAVWDLKLESPGAFDSAAISAADHKQAVEKLQKYVRLLGGSLSKKKPDVLFESAKTYFQFAEQEYCEGRPLIPVSEERWMVSVAGP